MKKLFVSFIVIASLVTITSCKNEEPVPMAYPDTYIIAKKSGETVTYGLGMYAYSNADMKSVVAQGPDDEEYTLKAYGGYLYQYYWESENADYSESKPAAGNFTFDVVFNSGETQTVSAALTSTVLSPAPITTCSWDTEKSSIKLAWTAVASTDYSVVTLRDSSGKAVWLSAALSPTIVTGYISASSGWISGNAPVLGATYTVELSIFKYDTGSTSYIQAKALTSQNVVWGASN